MNYEELVKALACGNDGKLPCHNNECPYWVDQWHGIGLCNVIKKDADAAAAIEGLQSEVERLKDVIGELREAQTYIDHYGDKWMTSAKDVPTSAYNHGYVDGKGEAEAAQPHWVKCDEALPEIGQRVIVYDGWMQFMTRKDDQRLNGKMYWENEEGNWERVDDEAYWMPIEPPKEDA